MGRSAELRLIDTLLGGRGGALLLRGEPGVGKTALLDAAAERVRSQGVRVLCVPGVEGEAGPAFSRLRQVVQLLRRYLDRLIPAQRSALERAVGLSQGSTPGRLCVAASTLDLLEQAAADVPLLLLVDDAQVWTVPVPRRWPSWHAGSGHTPWCCWPPPASRRTPSCSGPMFPNTRSGRSPTRMRPSS
ncbi:AAA family ATPase [Streptomyces bobili]|uniref:AAA family ATPase n=1 Tax=Streptomyces bobili TaxID=67280 RepID=UPI00382993FD